MAALTDDLKRRLERLPADLQAEFPHVPLDTIERDVNAGVSELTENARFNDFVPGPRRLRDYLTLVAQAREPRQLGHNPAAAVMMLVLMALLAAVSVTGWMATLDAFWGVEWVEELHEGVAEAILWLALIHAGAALYESLRHRENLVWAMVTGRKRV